MAVSHIFNGTEYLIPETNDVDWGDQLTALLSDLSDNTATLAAAQTFTNKTLVSPIIATITNGGTITVPSGTDTLVGRNTADVLTNKTLTAPAINTPTISNPTITGTVTGTFTLDGTITGGTINAALNGAIGGTTPAPGTFTGLVASSATVGGEAVVTVGRSIMAGTGLTGGGDLSANRTLSLTGQAAAFHALATDGLVVRAGATVAARTITGTAGRIVVANGNGTGGNPTIDIGSDVVTVARSITAGTGLAGGGTLSADRTLSLTGQALAVHNLASSGLIVRTGADAVAARTITGSGNRIVVTNGDGVAGSPTIDLGADVVTVNGAQTVTGKTITGSSVSGSTITSTTINGLSLPAVAGTAGQFLRSDGAGNVVWGNVTGAEGGTVTSVTAGTGLTGGTITGAGTIALATSGVTAGTYSAPSITVDAYGRITAAATATGASFSDMVWNSHVAGSAFASPWAEMGSASGGQGWFGSNLYNDGTAWKTRATHASIGARALTFNAPSWGDVSIAEVSGATTAGGTVTPTFRTLWHSGNFNPDLYAGLTSNVFTGKQTAIGAGPFLPVGGTIAQADITSALEVQSQWKGSDPATSGAAFISLHRPGNYAVHFGLDTDNKLKVGGWSMGANAYEIWHAGNAPLNSEPVANTVAKRSPDGSLFGNHLYAKTSDFSSNGRTVIVLGSDSDQLDAYFQMNSSTNTTAPAGARGLALVVNTGGFGLYTGRLSPSPVYVMDQTTKSVSFYRATSPVPVTAAFGGTITLDFAASNRFDLTATGGFTLANPSNIKPGQTIILNITHAANNVVMSLGSYFKTAGGAGVTLSTVSGSRDKVIMECVNSTTIDISVKRDWK